MLQKSMQHYWRAFELNRDNGWAVVQYLSLDLILRKLRSPIADLMMEPYEEHNRPADLWKLAHDLSINDLRDRENKLRHWALGNLVELYLIALLMDPPPADLTPADSIEKARKYAKDLVDAAGPESFEVYSTRRQVLRYDEWYRDIAKIDDIKGPVQELLRALPAAPQS